MYTWISRFISKFGFIQKDKTDLPSISNMEDISAQEVPQPYRFLRTIRHELARDRVVERPKFRKMLTHWRRLYLAERRVGKISVESEDFLVDSILDFDEGQDREDLLLALTNPDDFYVVFSVAKRTPGQALKMRQICAPRDELRLIQKYLLTQVLDENDLILSNAAHAYRRGRSTVSCMTPHAQNDWLIRLDIESFFPSISDTLVERSLRNYGDFDGLPARMLSRILTVDLGNGERELPQGSPTSGFISNLCMIPLDERIRHALFKFFPDVTYTRYADDLLFSGEKHLCRSARKKLISLIRNICEDFSFSINANKTRFFGSGVVRSALGIEIREHSLYPRSSICRHMENELRWIEENGFEGQSVFWFKRTQKSDLFTIPSVSELYHEHLSGVVCYVRSINPDLAESWREKLLDLGVVVDVPVGRIRSIYQ